MNKKISIVLVPIIMAILIIFGYVYINKNNTDAVRFKAEYENLNGKNTVYNKKYTDLSIEYDNPIKYSDYDEIIDIIQNKTGIIYLGFPECPWCRNALPVLLEVAKDNNIDTIYYKNIKNDRDSYIVENSKLVYDLDENGEEIKGTEGYFDLLEALDDYLTDYVIEYEDKIYETGEKRIYAPTVIFVKNGKVLGLHVSTVESQTDPFKTLTDKQYDELYLIYEEYIVELTSDTCDVNSSC